MQPGAVLSGGEAAEQNHPRLFNPFKQRNAGELEREPLLTTT